MAASSSKCRFGEVGLEMIVELTYDEWAAMGPELGHRQRVSTWCVGDWLNYGEQKWGEKYAQALELTGLSYSTLTGAAWVAREFTSCRRRQKLEWWPHSEAAGLDVDSQDAVLDWCETYVDDHDDHPKRSELRDQVRLHRREQVVESLAEMKGKYRVVYADPPWQYNDSGASAEGSFGKAEDHYPTMPTEDIANLPIEAHSRPNSVLFMWVTVPMLPEAWKVLEGWGFTYKTHIVWDKDAHVVGNYVSCQHELLLICTRGSCTPDELTPMIDSVQTVKLAKRKHSAKPEDFRTKIIQRLYTRGPYLEMFGRHQVDGWTVYGNQIGTPVRDLASSSNTSAVSR